MPARVFAVTCAVLLVSSSWAAADTYLVAPDQSGDFPTIQAAVDAVQDGDVVELADGTFVGDGNRDVDLLGKAIVVRSQSGNPEACTLDCEGSAISPHRAFLLHSAETAATTLSGVTITGGWFVGSSGGAILCSGASPTITGCRFVRNEGGAIAGMEGGGAIACRDGSSPRIQECAFLENRSEWRGGAIFCLTSSPIIEGCTFTGNSTTYGGAIEGESSSPVIRNSVISANAAVGGGGVFFSGGQPRLENCTVAFNTASWRGGGLRAGDSEVTLIGCTFSHNATDHWGGGVSLAGGSALCENTILAFSPVGEGLFCEPGAGATLRCCDVFGNAGGDWVGCLEGQLGTNGNLAEDPLFCGPDDGVFTLDAQSPCRPDNPANPDCDLIGAWPIGCGATSIRTENWGAIKSLFR